MLAVLPPSRDESVLIFFSFSHDDNSSRESRTRIVAQGIEFPDFTIQGLTTLNDMVITQVSYTPTVKVRLLRILFF